MPLITDLRVGETIRIGPDISITLCEKAGQLARLVIEAPRDHKIARPSNDNQPKRKNVEVAAT